jgi:hypothetical protein
MKYFHGKVTIVVSVLAALAVIVPSSFSFAAPPDSQQRELQFAPVSATGDIEAKDLMLDKMNPKPGDIIMIKGLYKVTGCIGKPFFGKITLNGSTLIEQEMKNFDPDCLAPNDTWWDAIFGVSWKAVPGTHTITFVVDSKNDIYELNEFNNAKSITLTVPFSVPEGIKEMRDININPVIPRGK